MIFSVGEKLVLKKPHPCGCDRFEIKASSSDVKLICLKCGRLLIMNIDKLKNSVKKREGTGSVRDQQ